MSGFLQFCLLNYSGHVLRMCGEAKHLRNLSKPTCKQEDLWAAGNTVCDQFLCTRTQPMLCQGALHHGFGAAVFYGGEATQAKCLQAARKKPRTITISMWYSDTIIRYEVEL